MNESDTKSVSRVQVTQAGRRGTWLLTIEGKPSFSGRVDALAPSSKLRQWCGDTGTPLADVVQAVAEAEDELAAKAAELMAAANAPAEPPPPPPVWRYLVRGIASSKVEAFESDDPESALLTELATARPPETVIEWIESGSELVACLDGDHPYRTTDVDRAAATLTPLPAFWWRTHGGGLRAVYVAESGCTAAQLAGMAAWSMGDLFGRVELVIRTRHPQSTRDGLHCGPVHHISDRPPVEVDRTSTVIPAEDPRVQDWLAAQDMEIGGRYPHTVCPIHPSDSDGQPPVLVNDNGIYCFRCGAAGDGMRSWGALLRTDNLLTEAAKGHAVWSHVELVAKALKPWVPTILLKNAYAGTLAVMFGDDPRNAACFYDWGLVRGMQSWLDSSTLKPILPRVNEAVLRGMPSAQTAEGKVAPISYGRHTTNQTIPGYRPVKPVRGLSVWGRWRAYFDGACRARVDPLDVPPPRWLEVGDRLDRAEVFEKMSEWFPGLNFDYLRLIVGARGWAESGLSPTPIVAVTGVSGAAKTTTVLLAAAILGDNVGNVRFADAARFSEALGTEAARAGLILLDEYAKDETKQQRAAAMFRLLDIRPDGYGHRKLYTGVVTEPMHSALFLTDIDFGPALSENIQVARRVVRVNLPDRTADWRETCPDGDIFAAARNDEVRRVWDSYISYEIDDLFASEQHKTWMQIVESCGFTTVEFDETDSRTTDRDPVVREFFEQTMYAPPIDQKGHWLLFDPFNGSLDLRDMWAELSGGTDFDDLLRISRLRELDLAYHLDIRGGSVTFDTRRKGRAIMFRWKKGRHPHATYNRRIFE